MKIEIKGFTIDTSQKEFQDCFDFSDILHCAGQRAKAQLKDDITLRIKNLFLEDEDVKAYIRKAKESMAKSLEGKEYEYGGERDD